MTHTTLSLKSNQQEQGFTLIELLIVIGVLGVLAAALLVALNPLEQLARGRDAGRLSSVNQLGRALQNYVTNQGTNLYPVSANSGGPNTWQTTYLLGGKEINNAITVPATTTVCNAGAGTSTEGNICYTQQSAGADAVVWTTAESQSAKAKAANCATQTIYFFIASQGKSGVGCVAAATAPSSATTMY